MINDFPSLQVEWWLHFWEDYYFLGISSQNKYIEFDFNLKDHFKWRSNNMTEIFNYIKWAYRGRWESKKQRVTANIVACITSTFSFLNDISAHLHYINLSIKHLPYVTQSTAHCIAYHTSLTLYLGCQKMGVNGIIFTCHRKDTFSHETAEKTKQIHCI